MGLSSAPLNSTCHRLHPGKAKARLVVGDLKSWCAPFFKCSLPRRCMDPLLARLGWHGWRRIFLHQIALLSVRVLPSSSCCDALAGQRNMDPQQVNLQLGWAAKAHSSSSPLNWQKSRNPAFALGACGCQLRGRIHIYQQE